MDILSSLHSVKQVGLHAYKNAVCCLIDLVVVFIYLFNYIKFSYLRRIGWSICKDDLHLPSDPTTLF